MSTAEKLKFEKEVDKIEAELGEEHVVRLVQYLTSNSPEANHGLMDLHRQCREVISKYPPMSPHIEKLNKRTQPHGTFKNEDKTTTTTARVSRVKTEKPRIMLTKRTQPRIPMNVQ